MNTIVKAIGGSRLYGINTEQSDMDIRGVFIERLQDVLFNGAETIEEKPDTVYHSLRKFARLLIANNPSALELLFTPESHIIETSTDWKYIQTHIQHCVLSQRVIKSYGGFLTSQLRDFEKGKSDSKALVHAYRLASQLTDISTYGFLNPVLSIDERAIIRDIYAGNVPVDIVVLWCKNKLRYAGLDNRLPEMPNEKIIRAYVSDIYYGAFTRE